MNNRDKLSVLDRHPTIDDMIAQLYQEASVYPEPRWITLISLIEAVHNERRHLLAATIDKLDVKPGEVLVARVGLDDVDDDGPWIPTYDELTYLREDLLNVLPEGVKIVVYHHGLEFQVISQDAVEGTIGPQYEAGD